jgi:hypothetical protein
MLGTGGPPAAAAIPAGPPDARAAIWALAGELERRHHITRMYARACPAVGVLSLCLGVTVWCIGGRWLRWHILGETVTWPASDPRGAAAKLAPLARRLRQAPAPRQI